MEKSISANVVVSTPENSFDAELPKRFGELYTDAVLGPLTEESRLVDEDEEGPAFYVTMVGDLVAKYHTVTFSVKSI